MQLILVVAIIMALPLARQSIIVSSLDLSSPNENWINVCQYLRSINNNEAEYYKGSKPQYGVFTWWNYGYWLNSIGHQATTTNNGYGDYDENANLLLSTDSAATISALSEENVRYIVIDKSMLSYSSLQSDNPTSSFMYKAYFQELDSLKLIYQADEIKVFEVIDGQD